MNPGRTRLALATVLSVLLTSACQSTAPLETVEQVDLERFMGDWYVIANIPTWIEVEAFNAIENYHLDDDGSIATTFTFRKGAADGPEKEYQPRGFVRNKQSNAEWGMQFVWPIKADYRIVYLEEDYSVTVIGRNKRDYVWLMSRTPSIPQSEYDKLVEFIEAIGYDIDELRVVPQQWPSP
jgi:apolipoprotein D and lipocalin family protein